MKNETIKGEFIDATVAPQPARRAFYKQRIVVSVSAVVLAAYAAMAIKNSIDDRKSKEETEED